MTSSYLRLFLLSAIWGSSYIWMRVAGPVLNPVPTVFLRVAIGAVVLGALTRAQGVRIDWRTDWRRLSIVGVVNSAVPFALICWAETHITASLAAVVNAASPVFALLAGALMLGEKVTLAKATGMAVAMAGVSLAVGASPETLRSVGPWPLVACVVSAACYAAAATYTKWRSVTVAPIATAYGSQVTASLALLPLAVVSKPVAPVSTDIWIAVVLLGVMCSGVAYALYFRLIADLGASRALTVTFLGPIFGTIWGTAFLHEAFPALAWLGCGMVLAGTMLVMRGPGKHATSNVGPRIQETPEAPQ